MVDVGLSDGHSRLCTSVICRNTRSGNKMSQLHFTSVDRRKHWFGQERVQWHHKSRAVRERGDVRQPP